MPSERNVVIGEEPNVRILINTSYSVVLSKVNFPLSAVPHLPGGNNKLFTEMFNGI